MTISVPAITETDLPTINRAIQQLAQGRSNAFGIVTLASSGTTTTVTDQNCAAGSTVLMTPMNGPAATEFGAGLWFISAIANGSFTIVHNAGIAGRLFRYAILG